MISTQRYDYQNQRYFYGFGDGELTFQHYAPSVPYAVIPTLYYGDMTYKALFTQIWSAYVSACRNYISTVRQNGNRFDILAVSGTNASTILLYGFYYEIAELEVYIDGVLTPINCAVPQIRPVSMATVSVSGTEPNIRTTRRVSANYTPTLDINGKVVADQNERLLYTLNFPGQTTVTQYIQEGSWSAPLTVDPGVDYTTNSIISPGLYSSDLGVIYSSAEGITQYGTPVATAASYVDGDLTYTAGDYVGEPPETYTQTQYDFVYNQMNRIDPSLVSCSFVNTTIDINDVHLCGEESLRGAQFIEKEYIKIPTGMAVTRIIIDAEVEAITETFERIVVEWGSADSASSQTVWIGSAVMRHPGSFDVAVRVSAQFFALRISLSQMVNPIAVTSIRLEMQPNGVRR